MSKIYNFYSCLNLNHRTKYSNLYIEYIELKQSIADNEKCDYYKKIHETSQQKTYKTWKNIHASTHLRSKLVRATRNHRISLQPTQSQTQVHFAHLIWLSGTLGR